MSGTLLTLAESLEKRAGDIAEQANELKIKAAGEMLEYLVNETPVDESTALSNWQASVGRPVGAEVPAFVVGSQGSSAGVSRAAAIQEGKARIALAKPGEPIYLSNLVPYIRRLNQGWSRQSPGGFVEAAVIIGQEFIRTVRLVRLRK